MQNILNKVNPYPSNDIKRKSQRQQLLEAQQRKKFAQSLMGQIMAEQLNAKKKKKKKEKEHVVDIWKKELNEEECREIEELRRGLAMDGIRVDEDTLRRGIVNENIPKHMTLIGKDFDDDRKEKREDEHFSLM